MERTAEANVPDDTPIIRRVRCAYCKGLVPEDRARFVYARTGRLPVYCDPAHRRAAQNARAYEKRKYGPENPLPAPPRRETQKIITRFGVFTVVDFDYDVDTESPFEYRSYVTFGPYSGKVPCNPVVADIFREAQRQNRWHKIPGSMCGTPEARPRGFHLVDDDVGDLLGDEGDVPDIVA